MAETRTNKPVGHAWNVTLDQAVAIQNDLAGRIVTENRLGPVGTVAGVDVGFPNPHTAHAAVVVLRFPTLEPLDYAVAETPVTFPYIPGLLAFREMPALLAAVQRLRLSPDLFIFDAQGLAHPRRLGLASHAGLLLDRPSIGCAKSRLVGSYVEPGPARGDWSLLMDGGERIGAVLRTRPGVKPVFVSVGHQVDLETAIFYVLACAPTTRLPETTRLAHQLAGGHAPDLSAAPQPRLF